MDHMPVWTIDWRGFIRGMIQDPGKMELTGQMRRFQIVFRIRVLESGPLAVWSDDGCVIRREGRILHEDRTAHAASRQVIAVQRGDLLEIAHWQMSDGWIWGAGVLPPPVSAEDAAAVLAPYLDPVLARLAAPTGPAIKLMADGRNPYRTVVSVYSMILNGYAAAGLCLYGEHQWSPAVRACFETYLPFASIVPTGEVVARLEALAGTALAHEALRHWYVLKTCMAVLEPPDEFCAMDDDVFVLGSVDDALAAFRDHTYVFGQDFDLGTDYHRAWNDVMPREAPIATGMGNVGLAWQRQRHDRAEIARAMVENAPARAAPGPDGQPMPYWIWEQGLINMLYADGAVWPLPTERYPFLKMDGLPGGMLGYDYGRNPCGFAALHFAGGWPGRPTDLVTLALAPAILGKRPVPAETEAACGGAGGGAGR
jgi:hypothetical protein